MGDRIQVTYRLTADDRMAAKARAQAVVVEQPVEFPEDLITDPGIREGILARNLGVEGSSRNQGGGAQIVPSHRFSC